MPVEPSGRTPSGSRVARDSLVGVHVEVNAAGWNIWLFTTGSVISIGVTPEMKQDGKHGVRKLLNCHLGKGSTSVQNKVCAPAEAPQAPVTLMLLARTDILCWAGSKSSWHRLAPHSPLGTGTYLPLSTQKYHFPAALPGVCRRDNRPNFYMMPVNLTPNLLSRAMPISKTGQLHPSVGKLVFLYWYTSSSSFMLLLISVEIFNCL